MVGDTYAIIKCFYHSSNIFSRDDVNSGEKRRATFELVYFWTYTWTNCANSCFNSWEKMLLLPIVDTERIENLPVLYKRY